MKPLFLFLVTVLGIANANALVISEILSNPTGDDSGREWVEIYNDTADEIDLSSMTISIKGGSFVATTPLQGGLVLPAGGYAIIGSTVSGATKFLQDYPSYSGILFRGSVSLVNTGVTSIDIKINGVAAASLPSYTAAKEGFTLSYLGGSYVSGTPTPGAENQASETTSEGTQTATTTNTQVTLPQMSPPSPDIIIYMPTEKTVVAGAESEFSVFSMNRAGKAVNDLKYTWAFGDGGQSTGSTTKYRYAYAGRYVAHVEASSATVFGNGRMVVRVVPPDIEIVAMNSGKYGAYIDIRNPNEYELDLSQWTLTIDGSGYPFPKNTVLLKGTTRFSGIAMGFASTTFATSTVVKILFPTLEEVTRYERNQDIVQVVLAPTSTVAMEKPINVAVMPKPKVLGAATSSKLRPATTTPTRKPSKDTRLVSFFKSLFSR